MRDSELPIPAKDSSPRATAFLAIAKFLAIAGPDHVQPSPAPSCRSTLPSLDTRQPATHLAELLRASSTSGSHRADATHKSASLLLPATFLNDRTIARSQAPLVPRSAHPKSTSALFSTAPAQSQSPASV